MAVPNNTTFNFQNVKDNVSGSPDSLTEAFSLADPDAFNPIYEGAKNSLLNFRDYDESDPPPSNTLSVSPSSNNGPYTAHSVNITVTSNTNWNVTESAAWITIAGGSGSGNGSFTINVQQNDGITTREAIVQVSTTSGSPSITRDITIQQARNL